jgi:hypothetical protein
VKTEDLDIAYTELCETMTGIGKERAELFLARFALLSIVSIADLEKVRKLIADASAMD